VLGSDGGDAVAAATVSTTRRGAAVDFPSLAAPPRSVRVYGVEWRRRRRTSFLVSLAVPSSTPLYMAQCDGGPPAIGLGAPDQGAVKAPLSRWAQGEGDLSNILPLDLTISFSFFYSITDL
jgi:hypothetical protein